MNKKWHFLKKKQKNRIVKDLFEKKKKHVCLVATFWPM